MHIVNRTPAGVSTGGQFAPKTNSESNIDLPSDEVSDPAPAPQDTRSPELRAQMEATIRKAPTPIIAESLDTIHAKENKSEAEKVTYRALNEAHMERIREMVKAAPTSQVESEKNRLEAADYATQSATDKNIYWACSDELDRRNGTAI